MDALGPLATKTSARTPGSARRGQKGGGSDDPDDAAEIVGTAEHPFWSLTRESWVDLGELQPGERLLLADGAEGVVESVQPEYALLWGGGTLGTPTNDNGLFSVYNFKVHEWHTYHVAPAVDQPAVFVHNAACPTTAIVPYEAPGGPIVPYKAPGGPIVPYEAPGGPIASYYPPNKGFASGEGGAFTLAPGAVIDRVGGTGGRCPRR
ncbi:MAG: polymorphic toxin-type HINT domain-containing protein [Planctomycetota bacterium]